MDALTIAREQPADQGAPLVLMVRGDLTIPFAGEFRLALIEAFNAAEMVVVNLEEVGSIDVTGLQLLCSAHREAYARRKSFGVEGLVNPVLSEVVELAGFRRHVGCSADTGKTCVWIGGCE